MFESWSGARASSKRARRVRRPCVVEALEARPLLSAMVGGFRTIAPKSGVEVPDAFLHTPIADGTPLAEHIHPHLTIVIDGQQQTIPALIGHVPYVGWLPIHTHTPDGTIHIESTVPYMFRLQDFFEVWGKTFNRHDVLGHMTVGRHKITMIIDGRPSQAFGNLVLEDQQQIVIKYV